MDRQKIARELVRLARELTARKLDVYFIVYPERGGRKHYRVTELAKVSDDFVRDEITALSLVVGGVVVEDFSRTSMNKVLDEIY